MIITIFHDLLNKLLIKEGLWFILDDTVDTQKTTDKLRLTALESMV